MPNMPPDVINSIRDDIISRKPDKFGVVGLNVFLSKDLTYCYAEAPNVEAVHKSHESKGVILGKGDVREVTSMV